jgi:hypothetical protein
MQASLICGGYVPENSRVNRNTSRLQLKCDGIRWRTGGEVKGKLANGVGSQYPSHYLTTSSITTAYAHTSAASSRLNWRPRWYKWTRPFRRKTKSGFCACANTFQLASNRDCISERAKLRPLRIKSNTKQFWPSDTYWYTGPVNN